MSKAVVDELEVIEIQKDDCNLAGRLHRERQDYGKLAVKQRSVRQSGQRIVFGQEGNAFGVMLAVDCDADRLRYTHKELGKVCVLTQRSVDRQQSVLVAFAGWNCKTAPQCGDTDNVRWRNSRR